MRTALVGLLVGMASIVIVSGGAPRWNAAHAQPNDRGAMSSQGELTALTWATPQAQHLAVLDPRTRVLSVYEINSVTGAITLRSARNVGWDLQVEEFNSTEPSPRDIRALLDRR